MVDVRYHWRLARYLLRQRASARYVFIHINKCGGTSVEAALGIPIKIHDSARARRRKIGRRAGDGNWGRIGLGGAGARLPRAHPDAFRAGLRGARL